jgi:hypothetical protein
VAVGSSGDGCYGNTLCVDRCEVFDAQLAAVYRTPARLLAPARGLDYASIDGHLGKLKAYVSIVGPERRLAQFVDDP